MLSLPDVRRIVRPESETYRGMQTVPIAKIVGSEGRSRDFNRAFLPRHDKMMRRWMSIDVAHYENVILPPIKLFEIGGAYFVRDGNHRVSVARMQGAEFIDAEVTSLASEIPITSGMSREDVTRAVIAFERRRFLAETGLAERRPGADITFTEIGRYDELARAHQRAQVVPEPPPACGNRPGRRSRVLVRPGLPSDRADHPRRAPARPVPRGHGGGPLRLHRPPLGGAGQEVRPDLHPRGGGGGLLREVPQAPHRAARRAGGAAVCGAWWQATRRSFRI